MLKNFIKKVANAAAGADQFHGLRFDQRRGDGHPEREHEPRQHEACEELGAAQGLHARIMTDPRRPSKDAALTCVKDGRSV